MGTMMPVRIWDYLGWQKSFWAIHRFPIKVVCGLTYAVLKNIGAVVMLLFFLALAAAYGKALVWLTHKSWEWGVTQAWNEIDDEREEQLDDQILQQELEKKPAKDPPYGGHPDKGDSAAPPAAEGEAGGGEGAP